MITRDIIINDILIPSLKRLYQVDYDIIHFGVSKFECRKLFRRILILF